VIALRARRAAALLGVAAFLWCGPYGVLAQEQHDTGPLKPAVELLDKGDFKGAESAFTNVLAGELGTQDRAAALIYLARIQLQDGRFEEADATAASALDELARVTESREQAMLIALAIRFEAAKGLGDDARANEINQQAGRLSARHDQIACAIDRIPGGIIHRASGAVLPEAVAGLAEMRMNTYDATGLDGAVTYGVDDADEESADVPSFVVAQVTVNLGSGLDEHFQAARKELLEQYPDAREITTGPITVVQGQRRLEGKMGVFTVRGGGGQVFATLHIFRLAPDIHVKFKATYPVANAELMRNRVAALMQSMVWPDGVTIQ
jgi:hypothetical protein